MRTARRIGLGVLVALGLGAGAGGLYAWRALPQVEGTLRLEGPKAAVRIERDADGIPTIHAGSIEDAAFGLGFVHAQDRLWQTETHRRIAAGRLAEAFGAAALESDRFLRALGVRRAAAAQWQAASARSRAVVLAYTAGINAFLRDALKARPPEFIALGLHPEPWTPEDSLGWAIMMAWDLGGNWSTELSRMRLSLTLPVARIDELIPPYPGERPLPVRDYAALFRQLRVDARLGEHAEAMAPESGVEGAGSNNWVIAGSHSATGLPLLANDPHLKLSAPALWYLARVVTPQGRVAGATLPALPGVILGQNEHVAWGFTNTRPDVQDLYLERLDPADPMRYETPDGWARFEAVDEVIRVRGASDERVTLRASRHGPVISDGRAGEGLTGPRAKPAYAIAMRWTALDPDPGALDAAVGFDEARSVAEFIAASAHHTAPMQNMVVADSAGHIGFVAAGRVPLRKPENDLMGLVPAPGWDARYDWAGWLPADATPREIDPPRGWIATANQRIHEPDYPYHLTREWGPPYRQERIEQLIAAVPRHDIDTMRRIQGDVVSLATRRLLPFLQRARADHPLADAARRELAAFDGTMAGERAAPLIFWSWVRHLTEAVFADEVGPAQWQRASGRSYRDALEGVFERDDAWWCDDKTTPARETCSEQADRALARALDELQAAHGTDVSAWRWDRAHRARAEHRPFSHVRLLAPAFELRAPVGGDTYTVNVSQVNLRPDPITGERYLDDHGPSLRALYDLADPTRSRVIQSSGQSGLAFSPLYRRFLAPWQQVRDVPLWDSPAVHTLVIEPRAVPGS